MSTRLRSETQVPPPEYPPENPLQDCFVLAALVPARSATPIALTKRKPAVARTTHRLRPPDAPTQATPPPADRNRVPANDPWTVGSPRRRVKVRFRGPRA